MAQHFHSLSSLASIPQNYTVIIGSQSAGSVPQLSIYLLLSHLPGCERLGTYFDPTSQQPTVSTFNPIISPSQQQQDAEPHFGIEVYVHHKYQLLIIHQQARSGPLPHRTKAFSSTFLSFIKSTSPKLVINLSSLPSSHRPAENKDQVQFFLVNSDQIPTQTKTTMSDDPDTTTASTTRSSQSSSTHLNVLRDIINISPTTLTDDEIEAQKQYLRVKFSKPLLSVEGHINATSFQTSSTVSPAEDDKSAKAENKLQSELDFMAEFPIPIKGGGMTRTLAKWSRKEGVHLTSFLAFPGPNSSSELTQLLLQYLSHVTGTFEAEFKIPKIVGISLDEFY